MIIHDLGQNHDIDIVEIIKNLISNLHDCVIQLKEKSEILRQIPIAKSQTFCFIFCDGARKVNRDLISVGIY
jgi:hypothetical protein